MSIIIGLFSFALVVTSILIILLVLVQLPKKEAGGGLAFGGGASNAVLGAGAGNALTRLTRNLAIVFLSISFLTSVLVSQRHGGGEDIIDAGLGEEALPEGTLDIDELLGSTDDAETTLPEATPTPDGAAPTEATPPPLLELTSPSDIQDPAEAEDETSPEEAAETEESDDSTAASDEDSPDAVTPEEGAEESPENP